MMDQNRMHVLQSVEYSYFLFAYILLSSMCCVYLVKTVFVLMCLYTLYFGLYFVCAYFSMQGHHALLGWFIFFLLFKLGIALIACIKLRFHSNP